MDKPQIIGHIQKSLNFTLYDCKWIPCSAKFVVMGSNARGTGCIQIYEIEKTEVKLLKEMEKPKSFKCGTFAASSLQERNLATGDFEGNLQIWDLQNSGKPVYTVKGHKEIINAIDGVGGLGIGDGAAELATAGRDGTVKIWDQRQKDDPVASMEPPAGETSRDCWTVGFGHSFNAHDRCIAAGYDNGDLKLFDLRAMKLRWQTNLKNGVCSVQFDRKDIDMNKLVATTLEGRLHVFDMRTQHPSKGFASVIERAHDSTVWAARHLPSNRDVFMTTGGTGSLNLWQYHYPAKRVAIDESNDEKRPYGVAGTLELLQNITLSTQPISSFDWSNDKEGLAVCTAFDQTMRVLIVTKLNRL